MIKLPASLTTVTLFSKFLALFLFLLLPLVGFQLGIKYQAMIDLTRTQQNNLVVTKPTPIPIDETSSWKAYENEKIRFKYPSNWYLLPSQGLDKDSYIGLSDGSDVPRGPDTGHIYVQVAWGSSSSYDEVLSKQVGTVKKGSKLTITTLEKLTIDGYPAVKQIEETTLGAATEYSYQIAIYIKGPSNVRVSALSLRSFGQPEEEFKKNSLPIFDQILSTFQFTDQ